MFTNVLCTCGKIPDTPRFYPKKSGPVRSLIFSARAPANSAARSIAAPRRWAFAARFPSAALRPDSRPKTLPAWSAASAACSATAKASAGLLLPMAQIRAPDFRNNHLGNLRLVNFHLPTRRSKAGSCIATLCPGKPVFDFWSRRHCATFFAGRESGERSPLKNHRKFGNETYSLIQPRNAKPRSPRRAQPHASPEITSKSNPVRPIPPGSKTRRPLVPMLHSR